MSSKRPCPNSDHESSFGQQKAKKSEQGRFPHRAYREHLKAKFKGLEDDLPPQQGLFIDAAPTPSPESTNHAFDPKTASNTYPEVITPATHDDIMTGGVFDLDAAYPSQGCLGSHHMEFQTTPDFQTPLSPHGTSISLHPGDIHGIFQNDCSLIDMSSCLERSKPGPQQHPRPEIPARHNTTIPHLTRPIDHAAPVQDRIRHIVDSAIEAGFTTFDEAIEAYYTEAFDESSPLDRDQRLSRNRRLPRLLGALRDASKDWSHWERRGFQEQITQGAEDILVDELKVFRREYTKSDFLRELAQSETGDQRTGKGRRASNSRMFQENLPNLWAFATTLLARTNASKHDSDREAVLRIMETLCDSRSDES